MLTRLRHLFLRASSPTQQFFYAKKPNSCVLRIMTYELGRGELFLPYLMIIKCLIENNLTITAVLEVLTLHKMLGR